MTCATILSINAGCQVAFVLILRPRYNRGLEWPVLLFGILAFICLAIGYIPIPFELIKRRGRIVGLSLLFLLIDWSGAFFSLLSLGLSILQERTCRALTVPHSRTKHVRSSLWNVVRLVVRSLPDHVLTNR